MAELSDVAKRLRRNQLIIEKLRRGEKNFNLDEDEKQDEDGSVFYGGGKGASTSWDEVSTTPVQTQPVQLNPSPITQYTNPEPQNTQPVISNPFGDYNIRKQTDINYRNQLQNQAMEQASNLDFTGITPSGIPSWNTYRTFYFKNKGWEDKGNTFATSTFLTNPPFKNEAELIDAASKDTEAWESYIRTYGQGKYYQSMGSEALQGIMPATAKAISPEGRAGEITPADVLWDISNVAMFPLGGGAGALSGLAKGASQASKLRSIAKGLTGTGLAAGATASGTTTLQNWRQSSPLEKAAGIGMTGLMGLGSAAMIPARAKQVAGKVGKVIATAPIGGITSAVGEGGKIAKQSNEVITASGRKIYPPPIRVTTNRIVTKDFLKTDEWLYNETIKELESQIKPSTNISQPGSPQATYEFQLNLVKGMNPKKLSDGDRESLRVILTGNPNPKIPYELIDKSVQSKAPVTKPVNQTALPETKQPVVASVPETQPVVSPKPIVPEPQPSVTTPVEQPPAVKPLEASGAPPQPPETPPTGTTGGGTVPPVEPPLVTKEVPNPQELADRLFKAISSPEARVKYAETKQAQKAQRNLNFDAAQKTMDDLMNQGVTPEQALYRSMNKLEGELPKGKTTFGDLFTEEEQTALRQIILKNLEDKPYTEKLSTIQAFDKAMQNDYIHGGLEGEVGTAGGSQYSRLVAGLGKDFVENMKKARLVLQDKTTRIIPTDPNLTEYLNSLSDVPYGQSSYFNTVPEGGRVVDTRTPLEKAMAYRRMQETTAKAEGTYKPYEGQFPEYPEESALTGERSKTMLPEQPGQPFNAVDTRTAKQKQLALEKMQAQQGLSLAKKMSNYTPNQQYPFEQADRNFREFTLLAPTMRERLLKFAEKARINIVDFLNIPRAIIASFDLSAPGRQGLVLGAANPSGWIKSWKPMLKALRNEQVAKDIDRVLRNNPDVQELIANYGLEFPELTRTAGYMQREESFASKLAEKIPGVRISERAYVTYLNALRADSALKAVKVFKAGGMSAKELKDYVSFVNLASGRAPMPKFLAGSANVMNAAMFSPRLFFSRVLLPFRMGEMLLSGNRYLMKQAAQTLVTFLGTGATILGLVKLAGGNIELDPRSSDFAKIKVGNTRVDIWGGYVQYVRLIAQLATQERKLVTGEYKGLVPYDIIENFFKSKSSPVMSLFTDLLTKRDYQGNKMEATWDAAKTQAFQRLTPLFIQDLIQAIQLDGAKGGIAALSGVGMGVTSYEDELAKQKPTGIYPLQIPTVSPSNQKTPALTPSGSSSNYQFGGSTTKKRFAY